MSVCYALRWGLLAVIVGTVVSSTSGKSRDLRACLSIADVNRRVECFEGREDPPSPPAAHGTNVPTMLPTPIARASLDCVGQTMPIEVVVCNDPQLMQLDTQAAKLFGESTKAGIGTTTTSHETWSLMRNQRCGSGAPERIRSCFRELSLARIQELSSHSDVVSPVRQPDDARQIVRIPPAPERSGAEPNGSLANSTPIIKGPQEVENRNADLGEKRLPSSQARPDQATASKRMIDAIQGLLSNSKADSVKFFHYSVDKKDLDGFSADMPLLRVVYDERVFFDTDKSTLRPEALPVIKAIATTLKQQSGRVALFVAGHTDSRGSEQYNLDLSVKRADSVANAIKTQGAGQAQIWRVGFGKAVPIKPNSSEQNMAFNRRVEFLLASQAIVLTTWIKRTKGLCEDETCGTTSMITNFSAAPITDNGASPISIQIPTPTAVEVELNPRPVEVEAPLR